MNETIRTMHAHRSIRKYTGESVQDEHIRAAVAGGQSAATSSGMQAFSLIHVRDTGRLGELAELSGPQDKVKECGAFFVICADSRRHRAMCARAGERYNQRLEAFLVGVIDSALFAQNLVLAFESLGYGTCFIGGLRNDLPRVDRLLALPEGVYPMYGLCVGVADEQPLARPRLGVDAVLFEDTYPDDAALLGGVDAYDPVYKDYLQQRGAKHPRGWSGVMAGLYGTVKREALAAYYESKGARF